MMSRERWSNDITKLFRGGELAPLLVRLRWRVRELTSGDVRYAPKIDGRFCESWGVKTTRIQGMSCKNTALAMIFKLAEAAQEDWRPLHGHNHLPNVILGVNFTDAVV
jgi:hypothetical protein